MPRRTYIVASHTHWDREWYLPFEAFRARLVRMMDALLDLLDHDPGYRHFALDGQTVALDDYLEIRPERRADIERLVRDGRLLAGPGYVLPDEFLIGGEAHVRNLMMGIRSARAYGGVMMVGYAPDAFGHIAHLPAILRGFGIDSVLIWRGVGAEATTSEFRWAAPDGSEVLVVHLPPPHGYSWFPRLPESRRELGNMLTTIRSALEPLATTRFILVANGTDHLPAHAGLPGVIKRANEMLDGAEMVHGDYPSFVENVRRELGDEGYGNLPRFEGEFRSSQRSNILAGVLSTRMWAKQRYQHCEDLLARYAEPLSAWRWLLGRQSDHAHPTRASGRAGSDKVGGSGDAERGLLRNAWRLLLQNGPHDSVTGCSVDPVYEDVRLRFDRCEQIAESIIHDSLRYLADRAAQPGVDSVVVLNPDNGPRTDFCSLLLPVDDSGRLPARLVDAEEREMSLHIIDRGGYSPRDSRERVTVAFVAPAMPGFGYRVFRVEYAGSTTAETEKRKTNSIEIENEFFLVRADASDGTLIVDNKQTGAAYAGLNRFVDGGERGDEYTYCPPERDSLVDRPSSPPSIRVTESGPARHTLEVRMTYSLPATLAADRSARSDETVACEIVTRASLYPGVARVDIQTEVNNIAKDHRLRAHFPTGIATDIVHSEQHFGVIERATGKPEYDDTWLEPPASTYPHRAFVDVSNPKRGLMVANRGLPDYEAIREDDGMVTIALTLLRCVEWLSREDLSTRPGHAGPRMHTPGAQMQGRWRFEYSLIPHAGGWQEAFADAHCFVRPLRALHTLRGDGRLPPSGSLLAVDPPEAVLSTAKLAEDGEGFIARVYNIAPQPLEATIWLAARVDQTERVDLNEENASPIEIVDRVARLQLSSNEIATLRFS